MIDNSTFIYNSLNLPIEAQRKWPGGIYQDKKIKNMNEKQKYIDFEAYERVAEPHKREQSSLSS